MYIELVGTFDLVLIPSNVNCITMFEGIVVVHLECFLQTHKITYYLSTTQRQYNTSKLAMTAQNIHTWCNILLPLHACRTHHFFTAVSPVLGGFDCIIWTATTPMSSRLLETIFEGCTTSKRISVKLDHSWTQHRESA